MNNIFKCISAFVLSAILLAASAVPAFAATSAKTGDSIVVTVSVEGEDSMGSTTIQFNYDKDKLDFLSDETLEGTGLSNPNEAGILLWADMFDPNGANYKKKTDVYSVVFVAKQDIDNVNAVIQFKVNDIFRIGDSGVEPGDSTCLSYSIALEGDNTASSAAESKAESKAQNDNNDKNDDKSNNDNNDNNDNNNNDDKTNSQTASKTESSSAASSKPAASSSSASSKTSSKTDSSSASDKNDTDSSKAKGDLSTESDKAEKTSDSEIDSAADSAIGNIDESEFESVPPIKLDSDSVSSAADSRGGFPKGAIIGIVVCVVIAAAGVVVIVSKKDDKE